MKLLCFDLPFVGSGSSRRFDGTKFAMGLAGFSHIDFIYASSILCFCGALGLLTCSRDEWIPTALFWSRDECSPIFELKVVFVNYFELLLDVSFCELSEEFFCCYLLRGVVKEKTFFYIAVRFAKCGYNKSEKLA